MFKKAFLDMFFPREKREAKEEEIINLRLGGMNVKEYFLKFTELFKYAPLFVVDPRDEMSRYVMDISKVARK